MDRCVKISNVVATCLFNKNIDLVELALTL